MLHQYKFIHTRKLAVVLSNAQSFKNLVQNGKWMVLRFLRKQYICFELMQGNPIIDFVGVYFYLCNAYIVDKCEHQSALTKRNKLPWFAFTGAFMSKWCEPFNNFPQGQSTKAEHTSMEEFTLCCREHTSKTHAALCQ